VVVRKSRGFSQFNQPGSFQPVAQPYSSRDLGPTPEQSLVSGPPLGDDLLDRYQRYLAGLGEEKQQETRGLTEIKPRRKERNLRPQDTVLSNNRPEVKLDFVSLLDSGRPSDSHFSPNSKWQGERETRLLQLPKVARSTSPQVDLEFVSPTAGKETFSPNGRWFGDKETGLRENKQILAHRNRPEVVLTNPSSSAEGTSTSFSPSRWLQQRELALDQPRTSSLSEPQVITLDNLSSFLGPNAFPDSFSVDVKTVLRTRGASPGLEV